MCTLTLTVIPMGSSRQTDWQVFFFAWHALLLPSGQQQQTVSFCLLLLLCLCLLRAVKQNAVQGSNAETCCEMVILHLVAAPCAVQPAM